MDKAERLRIYCSKNKIVYQTLGYVHLKLKNIFRKEPIKDLLELSLKHLA